MTEPTEPSGVRAPLPAPPSAAMRWLSRAARALLVLAILGAGAGAAVYWITHKPKARRKPPEAQARLVEVQTVRLGRERVIVRAMGQVAPARVIHLAPRVGGEIVEVSPEFVPGGRFEAGQVIARIDPEDFRLALKQRRTEAERQAALLEQAAATVAQRQTDVTQAECNLDIEMGQQSVAKREYELLGQTVDGEDEALVLRRPRQPGGFATRGTTVLAAASHSAGGLPARA